MGPAGSHPEALPHSPGPGGQTGAGYGWCLPSAAPLETPGASLTLFQQPQASGRCLILAESKNHLAGTFPLAVQRLGLRTSTAGDLGSIPGRGAKILQAAWHGQKKNHLAMLDG